MPKYKIESFDAEKGIIEVNIFEDFTSKSLNRIAIELPVSKEGKYPSLVETKAIIEAYLPKKPYFDRLESIKTIEEPVEIIKAIGVEFSYAAQDDSVIKS